MLLLLLFLNNKPEPYISGKILMNIIHQVKSAKNLHIQQDSLIYSL